MPPTVPAMTSLAIVATPDFDGPNAYVLLAECFGGDEDIYQLLTQMMFTRLRARGWESRCTPANRPMRVAVWSK